MKNKIIISSILTIAMCFSLIAGSTFALFTSESKVNVAVTSGEVNVTATVSGLKTSSLGVEQTAGAFANGGSATLDNGTLTLDKLTPGDKASFTITAENKSNVSVKYRITWSVAGDLAPFLTATVDGNALVNNSTAWALWEGANTKTFAVVVELLDTVGNDAQGKRADISFKVEAVQGNAVNETVTNVAQLQASLDLGVDNITLANDITSDTTLVVPQGKEVTLNLNGKTITGTAHKDVGPVVKNNGTLTIVGGTISSTAANGGSAIANSGTLTVENATLNGAPNEGKGWPSYAVNNTGVMTVNNCTITSYHGGVASYGEGAVVTLNNSVIDMSGIPGFTSHGFYTYSGGKVIVNGGTYANKAADQAASGASVINGNVEVNGGNFSGRLENYYGTPVIKGGTFSVDPTRFLAAGYVVTKLSEGYIVSAENTKVVENVADVAGAFDMNKDVTVGLPGGEHNDTLINITGTGTSDSNFTIIGSNTVFTDSIEITNHSNLVLGDDAVLVIDGITVNGTLKVTSYYKNIVIKNVTAKSISVNANSNVTIENCTIDGASDNGIYIVGYSNGYNLTIKNNVIRNSAKNAIQISGCASGTTFSGGTFTVEGNTFENWCTKDDKPRSAFKVWGDGTYCPDDITGGTPNNAAIALINAVRENNTFKPAEGKPNQVRFDFYGYICE